MFRKTKEKIKVYYDVDKADQMSSFFIVEFNLRMPLSANELLDLLKDKVGDYV